ncbi:MAG: hypothetical protein FD161_2989 [Limisphaerales bacterium]|nr:MAG: hypothetical protein FD161_2989 [Limisphaerales bacterium]KAG0508102.1 MAG: hypothetical protein E1N63_2696 [Limisphaerales bacterium]TXT53045.1 MAG: hypothetical protein FD140_153 [Limisphaerales bacterium]
MNFTQVSKHNPKKKSAPRRTATQSACDQPGTAGGASGNFTPQEGLAATGGGKAEQASRRDKNSAHQDAGSQASRPETGFGRESGNPSAARQVPAPPNSPFAALDARLNRDARGVQAPRRASLVEFLLNDARVPGGRGQHVPYSFAGREALAEVVATVDTVVREKLTDAQVALAGGAQFGKTILELNFLAWLMGCEFRNGILFLPDDDLVEGVVDAKWRPDVMDQIEWFAAMTQVGKALNRSGKAVNRKGAFLVTDGERKAVGMIRGLGKVPTTFSADVAAMDEVDDIDPRMAKFVAGRLTASDLRFILSIGTQRVHGRGMNKAWKDGSQGVVTLRCPDCGKVHNPEEEFPGIVRLQSPALFTPHAPMLSWAGDFRKPGSETAVAAHDPLNRYYLACVDCGSLLDRTQPAWEHRQPEQIKQRHWSFRISQLGIGAIDLSQIVARFTRAVADPEEMIVFRCDVLGLPQSTAQALTPATLDRARAVEVFDLAPRVREGRTAFGGLDMGDRCWLFARETEPGEPSRLLAAERMSAGDVVARGQSLFQRLGLSALFIDERPLVNESRTLALALNGLQSLTTWPRIPDAKDAYITLPGGLTWDGRNARWQNLKCAVVRFTKNKLGAGIAQSIVFFEEGGQTKFVPCIECNRFETIDRVVREFLTPAEGVIDVVNGGVRETPALLLPRAGLGAAPILATLDAHLVTGSEREKEDDGSLGDYVDGCENHFLLADGYSKLAEIICAGSKPGPFAHERVAIDRDSVRRADAMEVGM